MSGLFRAAAGDARPALFRFFFFATFAFLLYQFSRLLSPFLDGIVVAVTLALIFYPLHAKILRWCKGRPNLSASLSVVTLFLIVVIPTVFFLTLLGKQAAAIYPWAQGQLQQVHAHAGDQQVADRRRERLAHPDYSTRALSAARDMRLRSFSVR